MLKNYTATALPPIDAASDVRAAARADLLNNIRRLGGWDQQTALACVCTEEQIAAYNKAVAENGGEPV